MELLNTKKQIRKVRPRFVRSSAQHIKRISRSGYRKPKGLHNKIGDGKKGHRTTIKTGFGYPKKTRYQTLEGLTLVHVSTPKDVAELDAKKVKVILSSKVGAKKRVALLKLCAEKKLSVLSVKDAAASAQKIESDFTSRKSESSKKQETRQKNQEALRKAAEGKTDKKQKAKDTESSSNKDAKPDASETTDGSKAEPKVSKQLADKKEQDKVLTQKKQ